MKEKFNWIYCVIIFFVYLVAFLFINNFEVYASETSNYGVWVKDIKVSEDNKNDILGDIDGEEATVFYTPASNELPAVLTLSNANIRVENVGIRAEEDLIIKLANNTVNKITVTKSDKDTDDYYGIIGRINNDSASVDKGLLTITGGGSLEIKFDNDSGINYGINVDYLNIIENANVTINIEQSYRSRGISVNDSINAINSKIDVKLDKTETDGIGVDCKNTIKINNSTVDIVGADLINVEEDIYSYGINCGDLIMDNGFLNVKSGTVSSDDAINNILGIKSYAVFSNNNIDINGGEIILQGETAALLSKPIIDANDDIEIITGDNKKCSVGISEYEECNQDYYTNKYVKIKINKVIEDSEENEYVYRMIDAGEDIENNEQMYTYENMDGNEGMYTDESIDIDTHINVEEKGQNLNISDDSKIFIVIFGILFCLAGFLFFKCI